MIIKVDIPGNEYEVEISRGLLKEAGSRLDLNRKVMLVTDDGVPEQYSKTVAAACKEAHIVTIKQGEEHKSLASFELILTKMLEAGFSRKDAVVAVGGGICGDLAGFAAASYMRGVDFYNIPTTVLSQVDSSIGGKTAVNLAGIKNAVGAFYQPKKVLIDIDTLKTLPQRQISAGLIEALKMAVTFDPELFKIFEEGDIKENIEEIIAKSLMIKADVVKKDEKEAGLRKVLNFGHTIGHGIESQCLDGTLYHGECVALGMLPMSSPEIRERLVRIYEKLGVKTECSVSLENVVEALTHDKKAESSGITIIESDKIGTYKVRKADKEELRSLASLVVKGA